MDSRLKAIANHYGKESQLRQTMEECCELSLECSHVIRRKEPTVNLIYEIADVEIMLEQIKYLFRIDEKDIRDAKEFKINRQLGVI